MLEHFGCRSSHRLFYLFVCFYVNVGSVILLFSFFKSSSTVLYGGIITHTSDSYFYLFVFPGGLRSVIGGVYVVALQRTYAALGLLRYWTHGTWL